MNPPTLEERISEEPPIGMREDGTLNVVDPDADEEENDEETDE
jgi:hypothetical protein